MTVASHLREAEDVYGTGRGLTGPEWCVLRYGTAELSSIRESGDEVSAFVNHGRWLASCPGCGTVQYASVADRRMCCVYCPEARWLAVLFPDDWEEIGELLAKRPEKRTRNWAGDSLETVRAENLLMGCRG